MLTVRKIEPNHFLTLETEWNALLSKSSVETPFLRWEWMASWWKAFQGSQQLYLLGIYQSEQLVGVAPFVLRQSPTRLGFRTLEFASASDLYPDYLDILAPVGLEKDVVTSVFSYLHMHKQEWDFISLDNLLPESNVVKYAPSDEYGWHRDVRETSACPYIDLKGSMDEYMSAHFRKKKRYNLKRQARLALDEQGLQLVKETNGAALTSSVNDFLTLHEKRASEKDIQSSILSKPIKAFFHAITDSFHKKGLLEFWFLKKDQAPVSVVYGFRLKDRFYFYQSGVDPEWDRWSVGTVLLMQVIEKSFEAGLATFDFLKGDEEYKKTWNTGETKEVRLRLYRNDWLGHLIRHTHRFISFCRRARSSN